MTERSCGHCGGDMSHKRRDARYCSDLCRSRGYDSEHREKRRDDSLRYRLDNPEKCRETRARYRSENLEKCKASVDRWRSANGTAYQADWYARNREEVLGRSAENYANNRETRIMQQTRWRKANPEKARLYTRNWESRNPESSRERCHRYRAAKMGNPDSVGILERDWLKMLRRYGHCCAYCGEKSDAMHMDHVIPLSRGGRHAIGNVLPACPTCNLSKNAAFLVEWRARRRIAAA